MIDFKMILKLRRANVMIATLRARVEELEAELATAREKALEEAAECLDDWADEPQGDPDSEICCEIERHANFIIRSSSKRIRALLEKGK